MQVLRTTDVVGDSTQVLADQIRALARERDTVSVALSGGSAPWKVFERLATVELDWERVHIYQVDERVVPEDDPDRNLRELRRTLTRHVSSTVHPMPVEDDDLDAAAGAYAELLPDRFDLVHLGLGPDGHTASLVPGDPVLDVVDRNVAVTGTYDGHHRMTLTYPVLDRAESIVWIVSGPGKTTALAGLLEGDEGIPAARVRRDHAVVLTDL